MPDVAATKPAQPWWVDALVKFGIPSSIGVYLVWWTTSLVAVQITDVGTKLDAHTGVTANLMSTFQQNAADEARYRRTFLELAALTCRFNAKTAQEKALCDTAMQNWQAGR